MSGRGADIWSSVWGYLLSSMGQISGSVVWSTYLVDKLSDICIPTRQISARRHPGRISVPVVAQIFGHIWSLPQISECRHQISGCTPTSDGSSCCPRAVEPRAVEPVTCRHARVATYKPHPGHTSFHALAWLTAKWGDRGIGAAFGRKFVQWFGLGSGREPSVAQYY